MNEQKYVQLETTQARTLSAPRELSASRPDGVSPSTQVEDRPLLRLLNSDTFGLLLIVAQLALVLAVMVAAGLETAALRRVVALAGVGFVIHHFLPFRYRLRFFAALSIAALVLVMGGVPGRATPDLQLALPRAALILGIGFALVGICHLPLGFWKRAALLGGAGAALAWCRSGYVSTGPLSIVWPVLASMFMFRVIVYLYETSSAPARPSTARTAGYFFLLPNSTALLFPVVDFRHFQQRYYDEPALVIYQRGVQWMTRGVVQLLLYHFVNLSLAISPGQVADGTDLIRYVITNVFHYVKISGQFHLLIGLLLLFGFNLPETNRRYFLAASFTDYWRRVNIYWRDFMMRVFYYPAYFRLKKLGQTPALVIAVLWTFFITWALHQYQSWWLTGRAVLAWNDALFWGALALLVLGNSLWELKRGRQRRLAAGPMSWVAAGGVMLRTAATFSVITVLWSFWTASSVSQWLHLWSLADGHTLAWGSAVISGIMLATLLLEVLPGWRAPSAASGARSSTLSQRNEYVSLLRSYRPALTGLATLSAACAGLYFVLHLPPNVPVLLDDARSALRILRRQNPPGEARGYYERLTRVDPANRHYWESVQLRAFPFHYDGEHPVRRIAQFPLHVPLPNVHLWAYDCDYQTNRWGLRGEDCKPQPPPGTVRIALLGSSHVMGWGVPVEATFGAKLQEALNQSPAQATRFEVLNFASAGFGPLGQIAVVRDRVVALHPHVVMYVAHLNDYDWANRDAARVLRDGLVSPDPTLPDRLRSARVSPRTHPLMATQRLRPHEPALLLSIYQHIVAAARENHAVPAFVLLPLPRGDPPGRAARDDLLNLAAAAGFAVFDLSRIYDGYPAEQIELDEPGHHSNATAHALIAAELHRQITAGDQRNILSQASQLAGPNPQLAARGETQKP